MSIKPILIAITIVSIILFAVAVYSHLSLWFLWHLLPDGDIKVAVNSSQPGSQVITELLSVSPINSDTANLLNNSRRYAYSRKDGRTSIALVPKNPYLFKDRNILLNELNSNNWHTTNLGLVIIGTKNHSGSIHPPFKSVIVNSYKKLVSRQHPYKPTIIAQGNNGSLPLLSGDTALVGVISNRGKELKAIIAPNLNSLPNFSISGPALPNQANHLTINIPGAVMQSISTKYSTEWDEVMHDKLGFLTTKPSIIKYMAAQQTASISITDKKVAVASIGDPSSLKETFHQWMQEEDAFSRPQRHAFKLPDGTIGYELVKGDYQPVLTALNALGCYAPTSEAIQLWLCQNDKGASIATSQDGALQELSSISSSVQVITLGKDYLQRIGINYTKYLQALAVYSSGEYTMITASLKQD